MSAFALEDGVVYHTYSAYSRGLDALWSMWQWLDRAPLGRNEGRHVVVPSPRPVRGQLPVNPVARGQVPGTLPDSHRRSRSSAAMVA